jgi:hypothetical protein
MKHMSTVIVNQMSPSPTVPITSHGYIDRTAGRRGPALHAQKQNMLVPYFRTLREILVAHLSADPYSMNRIDAEECATYVIEILTKKKLRALSNSDGDIDTICNSLLRPQ